MAGSARKQRKGITELAQAMREGMSPQHKALAYFFINHMDEVVFLTTSEIAARAATSESTVVRFARSLGYDGYPDLQQDLQTLFRQKLAPAERMRQAGRLPNGSHGVFGLAAQAAFDNLSATQASLTSEAVMDAAHLIIGAERRYVIGLRSSSGAATLFDHYLSLVQPNVRLLVHGGPNLLEGLLDVAATDVAVAFSYSRYTRWTVEALEYAKSRGAKAIAITDSHLAPAAQVSDITLVVPVGSVTFANSYTGVMLAIDGLIAEIVNMDPDRSLKRLNLLEQAFAGREFFYTDAAIIQRARKRTPTEKD